MSDQTMGSISLDPEDFKKFITVRKRQYSDLGSYVSLIVLSTEMEGLIDGLFFKGKLSDLVTYNTDRHGKIRMFLAGVKTKFTTKLPIESSLWVLDGKPTDTHNGTVTPSTGPGAPLGGGTPIAIAA